MQVQDLALARQQVVFDLDPPHRVEMGVYNRVGDDARDRGQFAFAGLNCVQRFGAVRRQRRIRLVGPRNFGVEVPAVIVKPRGRVAGHLPHFSERLLLHKMESNHHIGYLHPGVVDVVLHLDPLARPAQHPHQGVAENRVSQMSDMRRFVGIDIRVLDDDLRPVAAWLATGCIQQRRPVDAAIETQIDEPAPGHLGRRDPGNRFPLRDQLLGNLAGGALQCLGQQKTDRQRKFAKRGLPGLLDDNGNLDAIAFADMSGHGLVNTLCESMKHLRTNASLKGFGKTAFGTDRALCH